MDEFTPKQIQRMHASWDLFRDIGEDGDDNDGDGGDDGEEEVDNEQPSAFPSSSPSFPPTEACDAPGMPCRKKKHCCSGKCTGKKKEKVCR